MAVFAQKFLETLLDLVNNAVLDDSLSRGLERSASETQEEVADRLKQIAQRLFDMTHGGEFLIEEQPCDPAGGECPCGGRCANKPFSCRPD